MKLYEPDSETRTHCNEYTPVSGDAPRHETDTGWHAVNSPTVSTGATGNTTVVVVVVVVVVLVVVVVPPVVDDGMTLRPTHTRSPTRRNDPADAPFNLYNARSPNPNRTASRDHESFGNATWNFSHDLTGCHEPCAETDDDTAPHTNATTSNTRIDRTTRMCIPFVW